MDAPNHWSEETSSFDIAVNLPVCRDRTVEAAVVHNKAWRSSPCGDCVSDPKLAVGIPISQPLLRILRAMTAPPPF
jgi:hypothetical protein